MRNIRDCATRGRDILSCLNGAMFSDERGRMGAPWGPHGKTIISTNSRSTARRGRYVTSKYIQHAF